MSFQIGKSTYVIEQRTLFIKDKDGIKLTPREAASITIHSIRSLGYRLEG